MKSESTLRPVVYWGVVYPESNHKILLPPCNNKLLRSLIDHSQQTETTLNTYMETLSISLANMTKLTLTFFPTPIEFHTLDGLTTTPAGLIYTMKSISKKSISFVT